MNRKLLVFPLLIVLLVSCGKKEQMYTYSNLTDASSQQLLATLIPKTVSDSDQQLFWHTILHYNTIMDNKQLLKSKMIPSTIQYSSTNLMDTWHEEQLPYYDINSKFLSFRLFNSYLTIQSPPSLVIDTFDLEAIETNPYAALSPEQLNLFIALYAPILITNSEHESIIKTINEEWVKRTLSFHPSQNMSLINLFVLDSNHQYAYIEQSGILFYTETELYYLEKYAPIYPYQLFKFKNKKELIHYLDQRIPLQDSPIILENNELLTQN